MWVPAEYAGDDLMGTMGPLKHMCPVHQGDLNFWVSLLATLHLM